jgi:hypothetical protein
MTDLVHRCGETGDGKCGPHIGRKIMSQTNGTSYRVVARSEQTRELTAGELDQIAGGTPSIPIPPPTPHSYAIGRIEARFPMT